MASAVDDTKPANGAALNSNDIRANMVIIKSEISALQTLVPGAALLLTGGTLTGDLFVNSATASTSTTTGALRVAGGVGVAGAIWAGSATASGADAESSVNAASFLSTRVSNTAGIAPSNTLRRGRGTAVGSPSTVAQNDELGRFAFSGYSGSAYTVGTVIIGTVIEPTPGAAAFGTRTAFWQCPTGSATVSELFRLEHATGASMFGANPVIDNNRLHRFRVYTVATLPAAGTAGRRAAVSDATAPTYLGALVGGGAVSCSVHDNGAAWVSG